MRMKLSKRGKKGFVYGVEREEKGVHPNCAKSGKGGWERISKSPHEREGKGEKNRR